jgi:hypothetical protein
MSNISSATTLTLTAYLTSVGRKYFISYDSNGNQIRFSADTNGNIIDNFAIVNFSLYDKDSNYKASTPLESGDLPALSGFKKINRNHTVTSKDIDDTKNQIIL